MFFGYAQLYHTRVLGDELELEPVQTRKKKRKKNEKGKILSFFYKKSMFIPNDIQKNKKN